MFEVESCLYLQYGNGKAEFNKIQSQENQLDWWCGVCLNCCVYNILQCCVGKNGFVSNIYSEVGDFPIPKSST